jgi:hypothetical protein
MIVVLTCNREQPYVEETLRQIEESAKGRKVILVDGKSFPPREGWEIVCRPRPVIPPQNKWTAWEAFRLAAEAEEDLVFFEDDLEFCKNAPAFIESFPIPDDVGFTVFFSPWLTREQPLGLWRIHPHAYIMAQAMKFPLRTVKKLHEARRAPIWDEARCFGGFDEILRHIVISMGLRLGIFNPGLVQHVGAVSLVGNGDLQGMRVAKNYAGKDTDANGYVGHTALGFFT